MAHLPHDAKKLLTRVRRIAGQVAALESALRGEADCNDVLVQIAAVRGAVHGLMLEVLNAHLRAHVAEEPDAERRAEELAAMSGLLRTYLR